MRINYFEYQNRALELKIEPVHFSNLTLLVGASGVGKSLILEGLLNLKRIARGKSIDGVEWEVRFSIDNERNYLWKGAFEKTGASGFTGSGVYDDEDERDVLTHRPKIRFEKLYAGEDLIVDRKENDIELNGKTTPKLPSYKSILNLFSEEESISKVFIEFNKLTGSVYWHGGSVGGFGDFNRLFEKYTTVENIMNAALPTYIKLALAYKNKLPVFDTIKEHFINIFPQVDDIRLEPVETAGSPHVYQKNPQLQIKEKNVSKWIFQNKISSGMFKTLMRISQLFLCSEGAVILIDEFENSLGINCIDTLTESLLYDVRNLQFILTSHHPYIINAIGMEHWKVISRLGGTILCKDAKDYKLGKSRHDAFKQLIQLADYRKGINV